MRRACVAVRGLRAAVRKACVAVTLSVMDTGTGAGAGGRATTQGTRALDAGAAAAAHRDTAQTSSQAMVLGGGGGGTPFNQQSPAVASLDITMPLRLSSHSRRVRLIICCLRSAMLMVDCGCRAQGKGTGGEAGTVMWQCTAPASQRPFVLVSCRPGPSPHKCPFHVA